MLTIIKDTEMEKLPLEDMALEINEQHRLATESAGTAIEHAIATGELLIEVKGRLKHGQFMKWLNDNHKSGILQFKRIQATKYMKAAHEKLRLGLNVQSTEHLGLDQAMKLLSTGKTDHQLINQSKSNEWYTPIEYINAVKEVMGGIDLDPASCQDANTEIQATEFFSENGLTQEWHGRVWLNPPYGRTEGESNQMLWANKLIEEFRSGRVTQACLLVNAVPGNAWFIPLWQYLICFIYHRIKFHNQKWKSKQPTQSNAIVYFGSRNEAFCKVFKEFGAVVKAVDCA